MRPTGRELDRRSRRPHQFPARARRGAHHRGFDASVGTEMVTLAPVAASTALMAWAAHRPLADANEGALSVALDDLANQQPWLDDRPGAVPSAREDRVPKPPQAGGHLGGQAIDADADRPRASARPYPLHHGSDQVVIPVAAEHRPSHRRLGTAIAMASQARWPTSLTHSSSACSCCRSTWPSRARCACTCWQRGPAAAARRLRSSSRAKVWTAAWIGSPSSASAAPPGRARPTSAADTPARVVAANVRRPALQR